MRKRLLIIGMSVMLAMGGGIIAAPVNTTVAATVPVVELETSDSVNYTMPKTNAVIVEKRTEFTVPANAGDNFEVTVTLKGIKEGSETFQIFFDNVTEDQVVANVQKDQSDRSALLNEIIKKDETEVRTFRVASVREVVSIAVVGNVEVSDVVVKKLEPNAEQTKKTVFTIGDSLVQTYNGNYKPQTGWGQTLSLYFDDQVNFVNHAIGGRSTGNFMRQGRLNETLLEICPGDIVLIEFGHNDANSGNGDRYVSIKNYKDFLTNIYIKGIQDRGGTPILVTVVNQNSWYRDCSGFIPSYPDYVAAMKEVATECNIPLIDLNAYTLNYYKELSEKYYFGATSDIIFNNALGGIYTGTYANGAGDGTHTQEYGAKVIGAYLSEEISKLNFSGISEHYSPLSYAMVIPAAPSGFAVKQDDTKLCRFTWEAVSGADFYIIYSAEIVEKEFETGNQNADGSAEKVTRFVCNEFELNSLSVPADAVIKHAEAGKNYAVKLVTVSPSGKSEESETFLMWADDANKTAKVYFSDEEALVSAKALAKPTEAPVSVDEAPTTPEVNEDDEESHSSNTFWITMVPIFLLLFVCPALAKRNNQNKETDTNDVEISGNNANETDINDTEAEETTEDKE